MGLENKFNMNRKAFTLIELFRYRILWDNYSKTIAWVDKIKKFYLLDLLNYKY